MRRSLCAASIQLRMTGVASSRIFFIVGIWTRRDMEGGTPRCRVGVGRLYEVDKVVGAVLVLTEYVK